MLTLLAVLLLLLALTGGIVVHPLLFAVAILAVVALVLNRRGPREPLP